MSIYRGAGGAGDATNDATSQSILAAASAQEAATSATSAANSATAAASSASAASTSATNAASSATSAATSATNASNSATSAASSASTATTKAAEAATSATDAASSATTATTKASEAASSATAAASSASAAATSATSASSSATAAASSATAAATSEGNAATSESNAASSASAASTSATNAAASETNAANSASSASNSATSAANSATTATTQASNAASSATAAATSASNAATSETNAAASATSAASSATSASSSATSASNSASSASTSAANAAASAVDAQSSEDAAAAYAASINPANFLTKANNLSDLTNTSTARTNLGVAIGTNVQAYSSELQAISNGGGNAMFKNRIINGAMMIDQRNAGASVTITANSTYTLDRWSGQMSQASKYSVQQNAGSVTPPIGFTNYIGCTSLSAYTVGAAETFGIRQNIEGLNVADFGWGTANATTVTLSFWVRSSLTGTFGGSLRNLASDRSYPFSYAISSANTWEQKSITVAGDTTGTWLKTNGVGVSLFFSLGTGSTGSATAGAWAAGNYVSSTGATSVVGTNGATFYITGVQLEKGSTATSFDYRPYGTELALCQRYYQNFRYQYEGNFGASGNGTPFTTILAVPLRATGTVTSSLITNGGTCTGLNAAQIYGLNNSVLQLILNFNAAGYGYYLSTITCNSEL